MQIKKKAKVVIEYAFTVATAITLKAAVGYHLWAERRREVQQAKKFEK